MKRKQASLQLFCFDRPFSTEIASWGPRHRGSASIWIILVLALLVVHRSAAGIDSGRDDEDGNVPDDTDGPTPSAPVRTPA